MTKPGYLRLALLGVTGLCLSGVSAPASAQYSFSPTNYDEQGIHYFGSTKDVKGGVVSGATIIISFDEATFVFYTDETGRFRGTVPLDTSPDKGTIRCAKTGFQFVKATKRPGPAKDNGPTMQVDCVFRGDEKK